MSPGGSYVASPPVPGWGRAPAAAPVTTEGMPTPGQIAEQQARYAATIDKQLVDAIAAIEKERDIEKEMLKFTAEKDVALYTNAAMEKLVERRALADEKATFSILELKKAAVERKLQLNSQAQGLTMDYEFKTV